MKLYFVRHGESKHNALNIHQGPDVELSSKGIQQARFVANRFRDIPIDIIVSSSYARAEQTATEINHLLHKQIFITELLTEVKNPSEIIGKKWNEPDVIRIKEIMRNNASLKDWHLSDEENFYDAKKRAIEFFKYLSLFKEENILAVTHGRFLRTIIGLILFGDQFNHSEDHHLEKTLVLSNTGITLCESDEKGHWRLVTWNDHAHLG